jgi:hypothetical protein
MIHSHDLRKKIRLLSIRRQRISLFQLRVVDDNSETSDSESKVMYDNPPSYELSEQSQQTLIGGSVNDRLLAELQLAATLEQSGMRHASLRENRIMKAASLFKSSKTDAERKAAIAEAQNLNGINPVSTFLGAMFALLSAAGLWYLTQTFAEYFALHPSDPDDAYFVVRVTAVSRNVVMGLLALASGFFGVTGFGILLLALRVGWGVVTGELNPAPLHTSAASITTVNFELDNVWDLMLNKKPKRGPR